MLRIQLLFSTIALFARIELELHVGFFCIKLNGVAVFEGSPIRYNSAVSVSGRRSPI